MPKAGRGLLDSARPPLYENVSVVAKVPETVRCPTCRQLARWSGNPYRPFCSERCKVRDLGNWASGRYRIPGEPVSPEADEPDGDDEDLQ